MDGTDTEKSQTHRDSDYQKAYEKWKKEILEPALAKHPERRDEFITTSSQRVNRLYTSLDNSHKDFSSDISDSSIYLFKIDRVSSDSKASKSSLSCN